MDINFTIPTEQEVTDILNKAQKDYSEVYKSLAIHGSVVYDVMPDRMRSAIYNHYKYKHLKVKIVKTLQKTYLVTLINDQPPQV